MIRKDGGLESASSDVLYQVPGRKPEDFGVMPQHHGCIVKVETVSLIMTVAIIVGRDG